MTADHFAASPVAAEPGHLVASFVPMDQIWAIMDKVMFYMDIFIRKGSVQKLSKSRHDQNMCI
jgi:hypothetical protein